MVCIKKVNDFFFIGDVLLKKFTVNSGQCGYRKGVFHGLSLRSSLHGVAGFTGECVIFGMILARELIAAFAKKGLGGQEMRDHQCT